MTRSDSERGRHHSAFEEYLEALFEFEEEGVTARAAELARRIGVTRAATADALRRLEEAGYVERPSEREILLTERGREFARTVVRRHRLAERLLTDVLGLPWHLAHDEACRLEHVITPVVEERIEALLGRPATSPFGNPIPRERKAGHGRGEGTSLRTVKVGQPFEVVRIAEGVQLDRDLLRYLVASGLRPGGTGSVRSLGQEGTEVTIGSKTIFVPAKAAGSVLVKATEGPTPKRRS